MNTTTQATTNTLMVWDLFIGLPRIEPITAGIPVSRPVVKITPIIVPTIEPIESAVSIGLFSNFASFGNYLLRFDINCTIQVGKQVPLRVQYTPSTIFFSIAPNGLTSATPSHAYGARGGRRIASSRSRKRGMKNSFVSVVSSTRPHSPWFTRSSVLFGFTTRRTARGCGA